METRTTRTPRQAYTYAWNGPCQATAALCARGIPVRRDTCISCIAPLTHAHLGDWRE